MSKNVCFHTYSIGIPRGCAPVRAADVWIFLREHRARLAEKDASRRDIIFTTNIKVLSFAQGQCLLVPGSREPVYCFFFQIKCFRIKLESSF